MLFQLDNGQLWWTGMKKAYMPEKVKLEVDHPKLFAAGNRCFAVVDQQNNVRLLSQIRFSQIWNTLRVNLKRTCILGLKKPMEWICLVGKLQELEATMIKDMRSLNDDVHILFDFLNIKPLIYFMLLFQTSGSINILQKKLNFRNFVNSLNKVLMDSAKDLYKKYKDHKQS